MASAQNYASALRHENTGDRRTVRTTVARRAIVGTALAFGITVATAGLAAAQSGPSAPSGPSGPSTSATTATTVSSVTSNTVGGTGLARTGGEAALPLAASAAAITIVLGGRRLANRLHG